MPSEARRSRQGLSGVDTGSRPLDQRGRYRIADLAAFDQMIVDRAGAEGAWVERVSIQVL
jgi:hypothetical protein